MTPGQLEVDGVAVFAPRWSGDEHRDGRCRAFPTICSNRAPSRSCDAWSSARGLFRARYSGAAQAQLAAACVTTRAHWVHIEQPVLVRVSRGAFKSISYATRPCQGPSRLAASARSGWPAGRTRPRLCSLQRASGWRSRAADATGMRPMRCDKSLASV